MEGILIGTAIAGASALIGTLLQPAAKGEPSPVILVPPEFNQRPKARNRLLMTPGEEQTAMRGALFNDFFCDQKSSMASLYMSPSAFDTPASDDGSPGPENVDMEAHVWVNRRPSPWIRLDPRPQPAARNGGAGHSDDGSGSTHPTVEMLADGAGSSGPGGLRGLVGGQLRLRWEPTVKLGSSVPLVTKGTPTLPDEQHASTPSADADASAAAAAKAAAVEREILADSLLQARGGGGGGGRGGGGKGSGGSFLRSPSSKSLRGGSASKSNSDNHSDSGNGTGGGGGSGGDGGGDTEGQLGPAPVSGAGGAAASLTPAQAYQQQLLQQHRARENNSFFELALSSSNNNNPGSGISSSGKDEGFLSSSSFASSPSLASSLPVTPSGAWISSQLRKDQALFNVLRVNAALSTSNFASSSNTNIVAGTMPAASVNAAVFCSAPVFALSHATEHARYSFLPSSPLAPLFARGGAATPAASTSSSSSSPAAAPAASGFSSCDGWAASSSGLALIRKNNQELEELDQGRVAAQVRDYDANNCRLGLRLDVDIDSLPSAQQHHAAAPAARHNSSSSSPSTSKSVVSLGGFVNPIASGAALAASARTASANAGGEFAHCKGVYTGGWAAWNHARFGGGVEGGHNHASGRSDLSANLHYKLVSSQNDLSVPSTAYLLNFDWKNWGREYGFSYLHRLVVRRQVRNPFEEDHVKGIQNYVDLGIDVNLRKPSTNSNSSSSNATAAAPAPGSNARVGGDGDGGGAPSLVDIALAMSWQINKNLLLKSRVDDTDISFVAAGKSWFQPASTLALGLHLNHLDMTSRLSFQFQLENFGQVLFPSARKEYKSVVRSKQVPMPKEF